MKYNRIKEIEQLIEQHHSLTNEELCHMFNISMQTLRRDLKILEDKGLITKVYGGVLSSKKTIASSVTSLDERLNKAVEAKRRIGELASTLVEDYDVIFVDSGTTAFHIIPFLNNKKEVTVITHSLYAINVLANQKNLKCIALGGVFNPQAYSFQTEPDEYPYLYNKAFISTVGVDEDGCTNTDILEGKIKQHIINKSNEVYLLVDQSKFVTQGYNRFAKLESFNGVICDGSIPTSIIKVLGQKKIKIIS